MISNLHWLEYFLRLAWVRGKAACGLPIRGDKNLFTADAAWRLKTGRLPKGVAITCFGRSDGAGMQAMARISGLAFAATFGATYVHSPFVHLDHADRDMPEWIAAWEELFGLGKGEVGVGDSDFEVIDYVDYFLGHRELSPRTVLNLSQCFWLQRKRADSYRPILARLREKYGAAAGKTEGGLAIAVHVRRGDVSREANKSRYTEDTVILATIASLRQALDERAIPYRVRIFSEGEAQDFRAFTEAGCELCLSEDALWTMRQLIEADILVMSKSSFSYVAALINGGIKIYERCANGPLSDWIVRRSDGGFDRAALAQKLAAITPSASGASQASAKVA